MISFPFSLSISCHKMKSILVLSVDSGRMTLSALTVPSAHHSEILNAMRSMDWSGRSSRVNS